jgi:hypothetical protein
MKTSEHSIQENTEKAIKHLYLRFFSVLGITPKNGKFIRNCIWAGLKFPSYPYIGRGYATKKRGRVLFIGLQLGIDWCPHVIGCAELRRIIEERGETQNPHFKGMAVATIRFSTKASKPSQHIFKDKTYKETLELASENDPSFNPLFHFAMTNCYKFLTSEKHKAKFASNDGRHISALLELQLLQDEIQILKPNFLVFQSQAFTSEHWFYPLTREIKKQNKNIAVYTSHHPAARSLHQKSSEYLKTFERL